MHKLMIFLTLLLFQFNSFGQDSLTYKIQADRIKALLDQRTSKFGEYDESLKHKTGIFGLQTKNDIRKSNDILREIIMYDQKMFKELNILLAFKDLKFQEVQHTSNFNDERILNYRKTISLLQSQKASLEADLLALSKKDNQQNTIIIVLAVILIGLLAYELNKYIKKRRHKLIH